MSLFQTPDLRMDSVVIIPDLRIASEDVAIIPDFRMASEDVVIIPDLRMASFVIFPDLRMASEDVVTCFSAGEAGMISHLAQRGAAHCTVHCAL